MNRKVTIIGAGSVGASIAYTAVVKGVASEIVLIDINKDKTLGEAMDIRQGIPFCTPCDIYANLFNFIIILLAVILLLSLLVFQENQVNLVLI